MTGENSESPFIEELQDGEVASASPSGPVRAEQQQFQAPPHPAQPDKVAELVAGFEAQVRFLLFRLEKAEASFAEFRGRTFWYLLAFFAAGVAGCVLTYMAAHRANAGVAELKTLMANQSLRFSSVSFSHWEQGQPPLRLIKGTEGICVLTKVTGHFAGGGESVRVWIDDDGYWYLGGDSHQADVAADCAVLKY